MIKGKKVSKLGMILAVLISVGFNGVILGFEKRIATVAEQKSVFLLSSSIVIFFSPVYICIILDKISEFFTKK